MTNLFWAFAVVWVIHVGYLLSIARRQESLRREIQTLRSLVAEKGRAPSVR